MIKNGKLFGLVNIIDLLAIVVVAVAVWLVLPSFVGSANSDIMVARGTPKTVYFTLELPQTSMEFFDKVEIGDQINDNIRGYYYGVVEDVRYEPAKKVMADIENGTYKYEEVPDKIDVYLTVKANGTESDMEITAEGQPIKFGGTLTVKGKGYVGAGYVVELRTE